MRRQSSRVFHLDTPGISLSRMLWFGLVFSISTAVLISALRCDCNRDIKPANMTDPQEHLYIDEGQGEPIIWEH